jgi:hypothetical protein
MKPTFHKTPETKRTFDQIIGDVEMFLKAKAIREWLVELSGLIPRLEDGPNRYYQGTVDGLTLVQYYGGPSCVGTPFGSWAATGGGCLENGSWFNEAKDRLGLVVVMEEFQNSEGCYGPVHAITKDLDGNPLPLVDYRPSHINMAGLVSATAFCHPLLPFAKMQKEIEAGQPSDYLKSRIASLGEAKPEQIYDAFADEFWDIKWKELCKSCKSRTAKIARDAALSEDDDEEDSEYINSDE